MNNIVGGISIGLNALLVTLMLVPSISGPAKVQTEDEYMHMRDIYANIEAKLNTEVSISGYYSNSLLQHDGTLVEAAEGETVYHFITVYDDVTGCSLSIEFTDDTYPEVGEHIEHYPLILKMTTSIIR